MKKTRQDALAQAIPLTSRNNSSSAVVNIPPAAAPTLISMGPVAVAVDLGMGAGVPLGPELTHSGAIPLQTHQHIPRQMMGDGANAL